MAPDLTGVHLKFDRAEKHIQCVREQTNAFLERDPKLLDVRTDETPGAGKEIQHTVYAVVREQPPPAMALPIGDAIQNIRSALDHLIYELSSNRARRKRNSTFPIYEDRCEFDVNGRKSIASITGDELTLIERLQPYVASDPPTHDPLSILRRLSNKDKHRLLLPVGAAVNEAEVWIASTNAEIRIDYFKSGPVKHDAKILGFTAWPKSESAGVDVHPRSALEIQLGDGEITDAGPIARMEIGALLDVLLHHARETVVNMWFKYGQLPPVPRQ